ncbi:hypothetical protein M3P05_20215, partial [Sansalvadorimonas sp. 2012CJ34-2]
SSNEIGTICRMHDFIKWGKPNGTSRVNHTSREYENNLYFFPLKEDFFFNSDNSARLYYIKLEHRKDIRAIVKKTKTNKREYVIKKPFRDFMEAYINIFIEYTGARRRPSAMYQALLYLESSLRCIHNGDNNPLNVNYTTVKHAEDSIHSSKHSNSYKYDILCALNMILSLMGSGYHSKSNSLSNFGFNLVREDFVIKSPKHYITRKAQKYDHTLGRLSIEELLCLVQCFTKSKKILGNNHYTTYISAVSLLPVILSMRISEFTDFREDFLHETGSTYYVRIYRSKIDRHQDIPLTKDMARIAKSVVSHIKEYSQEPRKAISHYLNQAPSNINDISELWIPEKLQPMFDNKYIEVSVVKDIILDRQGDDLDYFYFNFIKRNNFTQYVLLEVNNNSNAILVDRAHIKIPYHHFYRSRLSSFYMEEFIEEKNIKYVTTKKINIKSNFGFIALKSLLKVVDDIEYETIIKKIPIYKPSACILSSELKQHLFKETTSKLASYFPHWPFARSNKATKVSDVLCLEFAAVIGSNKRRRSWWIPKTTQESQVSHAINRKPGNSRYNVPKYEEHGYIFSDLNIKLSNGKYPSIKTNSIRKFHQTNALLAGVNILFLDEMSGRQSGRQSDFYDQRTAKEIISSSIEYFDPNSDFDILGPIYEESKITIVDQQSFIYDNCTPKQVTEIGGCSLDWSLNPCKNFGNCWTCDKHIWQKGDKKRLSNILLQKKSVEQSISLGKEKLSQVVVKNPIQRILTQFEDQLYRINEIINIENDSSISNGAIVTFSSSKNSLSQPDLINNVVDNNDQNDTYKNIYDDSFILEDY